MRRDPFQTDRTQAFLSRMWSYALRLFKTIQDRMDAEAAPRSFEASAELWESLRTVGCSNLKVTMSPHDLA
ncbi:MAG: hypothetical protein HYY59_00355 [Candidatus Omnitrophica bacterium]|nr:hypothetical protein [Candidatus Omnitrophota bacterium]MBI3020442.1 hypothetical protein [Candidatus Omnitrophota bacterium]